MITAITGIVITFTAIFPLFFGRVCVIIRRCVKFPNCPQLRNILIISGWVTVLLEGSSGTGGFFQLGTKHH